MQKEGFSTMIQEISPHRFHNEFHIKTPAPDSYFFYLKDGSILLNHIDELNIPRFRNLENQAEQALQCCDYLFSIDSREYYLIDENSLTPVSYTHLLNKDPPEIS